MVKSAKTSGLIALILLIAAGSIYAEGVRLKDIAGIEGVRNNQLTGYGVVVGLNGTGDSQQSKFTTQSLSNLLKTYGIDISADEMKVKNAAAVMVTAVLPPFARPGTTIDVVVSSLGDAKTLQGGTLLQTPLKAANDEVYAAAQGQISIGGFTGGGGGDSVTKNHTTVGRIPGGAIVEKETQTDLTIQDAVNVTLNNNDFTTACRTSDAINERLGGQYAKAIDGNVIAVNVPVEFADNTVPFIAMLESVEVTTDTVAKIIVNERTGTIIIGSQVRVMPVAVAHGALTVKISTDTIVSQPEPLSGGSTVVAKDTTVEVNEQPNHLMELDGGSSIEELVRALNALKVTPRDLISILQAIKDAGALQAQLEVI
ncbi:MAG: flagellar basal body P-ring protein FlgI [Armatimonadota bacterium]|nr:flagellar basal body P-ring protein FlgI [bacterium]